MQETSRGFRLRDGSDYYDRQNIENYNTQKANDEIENILDYIPDEADPNTNQLADKNFVNSSIQTSTAFYRGVYATWANVPTNTEDYPADSQGNKVPTNNDYIVITDASDYTGSTLEGTWRFKYTGSWNNVFALTSDTSIDLLKTYYTRSGSERSYTYTAVASPTVDDISNYYELTTGGVGKAGWLPEYRVNEKSMTAAQIAALDSGINSTKVQDYDGHIANTSNPHNVTKTQIGLSKVDNTSDQEKPVSNPTLIELNKKVNIAQGTAYAGKFLGINSEGDVEPMEGGGTGDVTEEELTTKLALKLDKTDAIRKIAVVSELPEAIDLYTLYLVVEDEGEWPGLKFTANSASTIGYTIDGSLPDIDIYYSTDGKTWISWDGTSISLAQGDSIYVWNKSSTLSTSELNFLAFTMTGLIAASGNCNSMIDFSELSDYCYFYMFGACTSLTTAPDLPATTLAQMCYKYMFEECTSLTTAPDLPATTLANNCYDSMFEGCTSLTTAPDLPATTLSQNCYAGMFQGCSTLTTAPDLPATTLASGCYSRMFNFCTSLISIKLYYTGTFSSTYFNYWVHNISTTGTLYYNGSDTTRGNSAIPTNWSISTF